ncbi:hypothetical protein HSX10_15530 [Winogradskyella undariae]|uniref:hypothetical protein n=1 Tax=Winogradskyella undariae TaxID=1285465 RepID=UPI00156B7C1C|nr:hypothetical protein [Winogradskyella undariae]NRR92986.1 hypothetical protein [Winogradskyella undariae]QNK77690.1 hypothetical protein H7F37_00955 [Winogradskyella sp. PAMC22761]
MKIIKKLSIIAIICLGLVSCDNDDDNATNIAECNYEGFSYYDANNDDQLILAESELNTQYFPNDSNGPYGASGIEIASFTSSPTIFFTTNVLIENETGIGWISVNGNPDQLVTVTCQRTGSAVGDEMRYDVTYGSIEVEFCVVIDEVL